jgi:putative restriction endonuclease
MTESLTINGKSYTIIDRDYQEITMPDCTVWNTNKIGTGHGEAKLYVGHAGKRIEEFFGNDGFTIKCVVKKTDISKYLEECKLEYTNPSQNYASKEEFPALFTERKELVEELDDCEYFTFKHQDQLKPPRIYVNSSDSVYKLIRQLSLPDLTYIALCKLKADDGEIIYYFRLFVDFKLVEKIISLKEYGEADETTKAKTRKGQAKYRQKLLDECPACPITKVADDRLLIASHIKPYAHSDSDEKYDPKNGFMFTPTYDWLFDKGFISFTDDKKMMVSIWISPMNCSRLQINEGKSVPLLPVSGRESYLAYHRDNIFKTMG